MEMRWKATALVLMGVLLGLMVGAVTMAIAQGERLADAKADIARAEGMVGEAARGLGSEAPAMDKMGKMKMTAVEKEMYNYLKMSWNTRNKLLEGVKLMWSAEKKMAEALSK